MRRLMQWPLAPFLLGIYPIIYIYSLNLGRVDPSNVITTLGIALASVAVLNALCTFSTRDWRKAALITDFIFIFSYLWTCFVDLVCPWIYTDPWSKPVAVSIILLLAVVCWVLGRFLRRTRDVANWTIIGNVGSILLIIIPLFQVARYSVSNARVHFSFLVTSAVSAPTDKPDVYYIILDGYARGDVLANDLGYDNSLFLLYLKQKGFYVADQSRSNYAYTDLSLASSLNMDYIDDLNKNPRQIEECLRRIARNKVTLLFKANGYRILQYAPDWFGPQEMSMTEEKLETRSLNEFKFLVLQKTLLRGLFKNDFGNLFKTRTLDTIHLLLTLPGSARPTFTFAHLLCPHPPYVFDRSGDTPEPRIYLHRPAGSRDWYPKDRYTDQVDYIDRRMEEVIDHLLRDSRRPPIIVVQGDHGAACDGTSAHPTPLMVRERMGILNAYYVPPKVKAHLYPSISPVNTFRLINNYIFGTNYSLLPDHNYYSGPIDTTPYVFKDVRTLLGEKNVDQR